MKYYSEKTQKFYDNVDDCEKAEHEALAKEAAEKAKREVALAEQKAKQEKLAAERKEKAAHIDELRKNMVKAQREYSEAITDFVKTYGTYHASFTNKEPIPTLFDIFDVPRLLDLL